MPDARARVVDELYPFESHYYDRDGLKLHYVDEGRGDPVVCLHGNSGWSFYYRELIKALRGSHRVLAPDHIGCGLSDKPDDDRYAYRLESRIDDIEAWLGALDIQENITLVMHDWGGAIGMGFAVRHPERVSRLVVTNTAAFLIPGAKALPWSLWFCRNTSAGALFVRGLNGFVFGWLLTGCRTRRLDASEKSGYLAPYDSYKNRIAVLRFVQDIPLEPTDPSFECLAGVAEGLSTLGDKPMLVLWGEKDFVFDHHVLEEWTRRFPDARVEVFPEGGHLILEDARDESINLIRGFLEAGAEESS